MTTTPYATPHQAWDTDEQPTALLATPGRPRRRWGGPWTAALLAVLVGAGCFYAGVRVEKHQLANSGSTGSGTAARALATRFGGAGAGTGASGTGASSRASGASGASAASGASGASGASRGAGGAGGGFTGLGRAGANGSVGTVSAVSGKTLYLSEFSGNTVKVTLSSATTITKSVGVGASSVRPGDIVVVQGLTGSNGTITASAVNDSGVRAASGSSGGSGSSGSSGGGSGAALNSLFGSGG